MLGIVLLIVQVFSNMLLWRQYFTPLYCYTCRSELKRQYQ